MIKATSAKIVGRSHEAIGTSCQDAVYTRNLKSMACIALADGAGSKPYSAIGANFVAKLATHKFLDDFEQLYVDILQSKENLASDIISSFKEGLELKANKKKCEISNYASTLLFFACDKNRYIAGHIGDGAIIARFESDMVTLSEPENGEYANLTYFITDKDAGDHLRLYAGEYNESLGVFLMSDGTSESLFSKSNKQAGVGVSKLLDIFFKIPSVEMKKVLQMNLEKLISVKSADDCSIASLVVLSK